MRPVVRPRKLTPKDFGGLFAWYDASDASTMTLSTTKVTQWRDKSGMGNHLNQSIANNQPTYTPRTPTTIAYVDFSIATTPSMATASNSAVPAGTNPCTLIAVYTPRGSNAAASYVSMGYPTAEQSRMLTSTGSHDPYFAGTSDDVDSAQSYLADSIMVVSATFANGVATVAKNGSPPVSKAVSWVTSANNPIYICSRDDAVAGQKHRAHEYAFYIGLLSPRDIQRLEGAMAWKWGFPTKLAASHAYRYRAPLVQF